MLYNRIIGKRGVIDFEKAKSYCKQTKEKKVTVKAVNVVNISAFGSRRLVYV